MVEMLELGDEMQAEPVGGTPDFMWRCRRELGFRVEMSEERWILCVAEGRNGGAKRRSGVPERNTNSKVPETS